ncbi:winged helix-turn-helix transcriptional regulator [Blautia sp. MSJ-9]|uniref:winged helix-turn-helix transcriptional regulator n=1 Tax=Blautia sp. MSJ-9 TaxID=2841511 RepID=UPI001C0F66E7|nr:winged helix-turn-helix transcriptional regulator [Blautia sp. MSJ-9]MBU5681420.1 winged helix-turn-helix transcriptional regulator [Blautia sp. MSJ-9]
MKKSITPNQIRENNRNLIYQYIYRKEKVSQQDIAYDLHLSSPTVTTNLSSLEEDGLINKIIDTCESTEQLRAFI